MNFVKQYKVPYVSENYIIRYNFVADMSPKAKRPLTERKLGKSKQAKATKRNCRALVKDVRNILQEVIDRIPYEDEEIERNSIAASPFESTPRIKPLTFTLNNAENWDVSEENVVVVPSPSEVIDEYDFTYGNEEEYDR